MHKVLSDGCAGCSPTHQTENMCMVPKASYPFEVCKLHGKVMETDHQQVHTIFPVSINSRSPKGFFAELRLGTYPKRF